MHWWGAAAKMVIFNNKIKVLTIVFTGLVTLVATKEWLTKFFNSEVNLLNVKEVGEHGVQLEIGIPRPGEHWICLSATECGAVKGQEGGVKEVATYSAEIQGSTTPTSPG